MPWKRWTTSHARMWWREIETPSRASGIPTLRPVASPAGGWPGPTNPKEGTVFEFEHEVPAECECDNTHDQNDTVCRYCWAHGRRKPSDPEVSTTAIDPP